MPKKKLKCPECGTVIKSIHFDICNKCGFNGLQNHFKSFKYASYHKKKRERSKQKQKISYGRKIKYNWDEIELINRPFGVTRETCYVDGHGYLRWKNNRRLCHRDIAFEYVFKRGNYPNEFSKYDIHHKDGNRFNNLAGNLEVISREDHEVEHGKILYEEGRKYIRIARVNRKRASTRKALLIGGKRGIWYPWSQLLIRNGYVYATEWILKQKGAIY